MDEQFITHKDSHFITRMRSHIEVEVSSNFDHIKRSGKSFIAWHPTANDGKHLWTYFKQHNLPAYFVERGALPNTVFIDPNGFLLNSTSYREHNWNTPLSSLETNQIDDYIHSLRSEESSLEFQESNRMGGTKMHKHLKLNNDSKVIFVPMQLANDRVITQWSGWAKGVPEFQQIIRQLSSTLPQYTFLVKNHPISANPNSQTPRMQSHKNVVVVDNFHYKDCLEVADVVLTINSGVGLQAMAWDVPVIVVGDAFYQFEEINYNAQNFSQIVNLLQQTLTINTSKAKQFLYFLKYKMYSDCILKKLDRDKYHNRTSDSKYINVRIFKS